jgi:flagellar basal body-associated protein FliL
MKKSQLVLGIIILIILQAVTAYMIVDRIVVPKIAALHATPAATTAKAATPADTTAHIFSVSVGLDKGIATTYEVVLHWTDAQTKRKVEENNTQIEATLKKLLEPVRAEDLNDQVKRSGIKKNLTDAINKQIAPMRIADLSVSLQPM